MTRIVSGTDLLARKLARKDKVVPADSAWLDVLGTPGHRTLFATIARHAPRSIGELSALVDRAQPNVSRSLVALVRAGLVTIVPNGRASVPTLSELGREKIGEILALEPAATDHATSPVAAGADAEGPAPFLFVSSQASADPIALRANAPIRKQIVVADSKEGLFTTAHRLVDHWWRIWCRRDAPFKVGTFSSASAGDLTLLLVSKGSRIERTLRFPPGSQPPSTSDVVDSNAFQREVLQWVLRPLAASTGRGGSEPDERFVSRLSRLDDSYDQPAEREFCRTAGALQMSPYDLTNEAARLVRDFIASMPEEDARLDFASTMDLDEVEGISRQIDRGLAKLGDRNNLALLPDAIGALGGKVSGLAESGLKPWQKGTVAAKALRGHFRLGTGTAVGNAERLAALCGADRFVPQDIGSQEILAFQAEVNHAPTVLVQKQWGPLGSAFFLARAVGDYLVFQSKKSCVANKYTDRQAVGRAFAAEFLAPAEGVVSMIDEDGRSKAAVAAHYGVSVEVVHHQYQNNYAV